jgi:hypothetical protein
MNMTVRRVLWPLIFVFTMLAGCQQAAETSPPVTGVVSGKICYPPDAEPAVTLYFQQPGSDQAVTLHVEGGQETYSQVLAPGSYQVFAWMPRNILQGGVYSEAASCGSGADCSHALLPVEVTAGEETKGVDICDWDADPFDVPLPPDLIENLVVYAWRAQHPDFADSTPLTLEELTMDGQLIDQLGVRVFRVVEGPLENETFLVLGDGPVMRLGEAEGGQGVSSLALSDLDGDGQSELYLSYSFGSGIHQSHLAVYAPTYNDLGTYKAQAYYLGDLSLFSDEPGQVGVRAVESDSETLTLKYLDTLGTLSLEQVDGQVQLKFNQAEGLPEDLQELIVYPEGSLEGASQLWRTVEDPHHGVRFAVPCFWEVGILETPPPTDAYAYPIRNYSDAYANSFGKNKQPLWDSGAIKIDMDFLSGSNWNLSPDATPEDLLAALYDEDSNLSVLGVEKEVINGQEGRLVTAESTFDGEVQFYLFKVSDQLFLMFGPRKGTLNHPDVQAILGSLALRPGVEVHVPGIVPAGSPDGEVPLCMQESD